MVIDIIYTRDGYEVWWLHELDNARDIDPDDLYHCEYNCLEFIEEEIMSGNLERDDITNYVEEWQEKIDMFFSEKEILDGDEEEDEEEE
tara:strand:+ start:20 stop:286 length:267 start_codon:yes stop_codon:yes gene_type:complete